MAEGRSVFNGPPPVIRVLATEAEETKSVATWLAEQSQAGVLPHEFGLFVRSPAQLTRAQAAVKESGLAFKLLDEHVAENEPLTIPCVFTLRGHAPALLSACHSVYSVVPTAVFRFNGLATHHRKLRRHAPARKRRVHLPGRIRARQRQFTSPNIVGDDVRSLIIRRPTRDQRLRTSSFTTSQAGKWVGV